MITVDSKQQVLIYQSDDDSHLKTFPISTAKNGLGEARNSLQTPRGWHEVRAKIGANYPVYAVFKGRRPTGDVFQLGRDDPDATDWILTRILWLSGLTLGQNRLGAVDTMQRYIYIHGTACEYDIGKPVSHGCIRMRNHDIIELFNWVSLGEKVFIA